MAVADAAAVLRIYQLGLDSGQASFQTEAPAWSEFDAAKLPDHRYVAECDGSVIGWVAITPVSSRPVYAGVVEHSVYVDPAVQGRGVGLALMAVLIASTEKAGIWMLQAAVFPENTASVRLHERVGFRVVGRRERIGCHHGVWRDTVLLERRSAIAGLG